MSSFSWQDLQKAADAVGLAWVMGNGGGWNREPVKALAEWDGGEPMEDHLSRELKTVRVRWFHDEEGKLQREPWVWVYRGEDGEEYAVMVRLNSNHASDETELVIARGLPAYLQLLRQLRQAGFKGGSSCT